MNITAKRATMMVAAIAVMLGGLGIFQSAQAATANLVANNTNFGNPAGTNGVVLTTNIVEGDTVTWTNGAGFHNVTRVAENVTTAPPLTVFTPNGFASATPLVTFSETPTFAVAGTYFYVCTIHADDMRGVINVAPAVVDTAGPVTSAVVGTPNPTNGAGSVAVTATVDDTLNGGSAIAAAEYSVGAIAAAAGTGTPMNAVVAPFDSVSEGVTANVSTAGTLPGGTLTVWVRGRDSAGNWGAAASVVISITAVPAGAETATVSVTAGSLANVTNPVDFGPLQLSGSDQELAASPIAWTATDATGAGAGWNVTITSSDFSSAGGTISVSNFRVALAQAAIVTVSGNAAPLTGAATAVTLDTVTPLTLLSAAGGTGMGSYEYTPDFALTIPADAAPGSYSASMVVSINAGP